ncbi:unnamed protein product [Clonostachys rhizophaga]|uniref:NADH-cytochrome b5 reductase n=1 Tax=Clonostachys rhizophaga TaxID=160324 RepID=A0A9N9YQU2_9HYPO|nr:unnamed protein product [Clonostachys rhizophaga]
MGKGQILHRDEFRDLQLVKKTRVSGNVSIYRLALPKPSDTLNLPIGQHISLRALLPGNPKPVIRSYTPISLPDAVGYMDLMVKTYPHGNMSKYLDTMQIGEKVEVRGPKGVMVYQPNMVRAIGMIAGGTGITPMLQIIRAITNNRPKANGKGDKTQIHLIYANVQYEDILLKDELDELVLKDENLNVHYVLNKPPKDWEGGIGYVTEDMVTKHLPTPSDDVKLLLCGPLPMVGAVKQFVESLGFHKARPVSKLEDQVFSF